MVAAVAAVRARARERIALVNETTEQEVLALGDSIQSIVREAKDYAAEVRAQLSDLSGESGISGALAGQSETVRRMSHELGEGLGALSGQAGAAEALCRDILEIGDRVYEVSIATKVLAVNARLEAARAVDGGSFGVIAHEMSALNRAVQASNAEINQIARKLLVLLPEIQRMSSQLRAEAEQRQLEIERHGVEVAEGEAALRRALVSCLALGEERVARIVDESRQAARHLVFQDPMAQTLMRIDADLHALEQGALGAEAIAPMQQELGRALGEAEALVGEDEDFVFL